MTIPDILIVGSGPSGVNAAWPLVKAGLSVVMIDGQRDRALPQPNISLADFRKDEDRWTHVLGRELQNAQPLGNRSPKFVTPLGQSVLATNNDTLHIRTSGFFAPRSFAAGGLSNIWGALASAFDENDMRGFPFAVSELRDSYREIAERIGISGSPNDDLGKFHGDEFPIQPPNWLLPVAGRVIEKYARRKKDKDFKLGLARNAVLTHDKGERQACNLSGMCLYGCSRHSIYNSAHEISALQTYPNFKYMTGYRVLRLLDVGGALQTVETESENGKVILSARKLILAAGTINTTALVLHRYNVLGKKLRLLSSPTAALAFFLPSRSTFIKAKGHFSLGQLSYVLNLNDANSGYVTGSFYSVDTLPLTVIADRLPLSRPTAMKFATALAPHLLIANCFSPGEYSQNTMSLQTGWNGPEIYIEGHHPSETRKMLKTSIKRLSSTMLRLGAITLPGSFSIVEPGADAHIGGTLPMRAEGDELTCLPTGELRVWPGVYIVDGANMSAMPAKHCTFTFMANADRIGKGLARRLKEST